MKVLLICGYFARENEQEVINHARANVEFSANEFQRKLIGGLQSLKKDLYVVSAPLIGSYPNACSIRTFRGFQEKQAVCQYVSFNNVWGLRNFSRAKQLKKAIRFFTKLDDPEKIILVYCAHTPFLEAAAWAKQQDPRIRICFYVPDLPDYMNLSANRSKLYDIAKTFDIAKMRRFMALVDGYVLLTEPMKEMLPVGEKPCLVREGILEADQLKRTTVAGSREDDCKYIVYTGKIYQKFGIPALVDGFSLLPQENCRLVLCGDGDCMDYVRQAAEKDPRILVQGQVAPKQALQWQQRAAVLVNPRPDNEIYTKYSFPSKNLEYLITGKPVVAYKLSGMPDVYREFLYEITGLNAQDLAEALYRAVTAAPVETERKYKAFLAYVQEHLMAGKIAEKLLELGK